MEVDFFNDKTVSGQYYGDDGGRSEEYEVVQ